jgi:hypothetical protein
MEHKTYLHTTETSCTTTLLPLPVVERCEQFEKERGAEILAVHHVGGNKWQAAYAVNRGTKRHQEWIYKFTV